MICISLDIGISSPIRQDSTSSDIGSQSMNSQTRPNIPVVVREVPGGPAAAAPAPGEVDVDWPPGEPDAAACVIKALVEFINNVGS